jgi:dipeptidyl aminopeptidase/acylaminoacyl peptidase
MKTLVRIVLTLGLLAAAVAWMLDYRPASAATPPSLTVSANELNVRQGPGTNYAVSAVLQGGAAATALGRDATGAWYEPQLADGSTGWLSAAYVQASGDVTSLPVVAAPATASAPTTTTGGSHIVFQTSSGGAIYIMNPDGSGLRALTTGMDPALSPDGQQVAFTRWDGGSGDGALGSVWVINIDGSGERKIEGDVRQPKSPTWSPDGRQIVINMQQGGTIAAVRQTITVTPGSRPNIPAGAYDIVRNGNTLSFTVPANPYWGLRLINVGDGAYQDLPRDLHSFAPTWDPAHADLIVYHGDHGLMNLSISGGNTLSLTSNTDQRAPVFSPDGSKIAASFRQNDHWEVHVMNADGSNEIRLTETPLTTIVAQEINGQQAVQWNNAAPAWSPDGSQIAFLSDRTGAWEIWIMNADGSNQHPLFANGMPNGVTIQYNGVDERVISWR